MKPPQEMTNEELAAQLSTEEILRGLEYAMDWKNQKPDAVKFACSIADARQWIIDARAEIASLRAIPAPTAPNVVAGDWAEAAAKEIFRHDNKFCEKSQPELDAVAAIVRRHAGAAGNGEAK